MKSSANDQTSFSQSPFFSKSLWATEQLSAFTANHCPSVEWYVATFWHLSPFEMRSAASGRWERQTKASSVPASLKIWLLFKWGWKKDTGKGTPISKMESPSESAQHEQLLSELKPEKKELHWEAAVLNFSSATSQFIAHLYRQRLCQSRTEFKSDSVDFCTFCFAL